MRWMWSCFAVQALAILGLTKGINPCLDSDSSEYKCGDSGRSLQLDSCGLTDEDIGDMYKCYETFGTDNMEVLVLDDNELISASADIFSGLTSVEYLFLNSNNLTSLPETIFYDMPQLQYLYMNFNQLSSLPEVIFAQNPLLWDMEIQYNLLSFLPSGIFSGLESLGRLALRNNLLTTLPEAIFNDLSSLYLVDLNGNEGLQCVPSTTSEYVNAPEEAVNGICVCSPDEAIECDYIHNYCEPGSADAPGYYCKVPAPGT